MILMTTLKAEEQENRSSHFLDPFSFTVNLSRYVQYFSRPGFEFLVLRFEKTTGAVLQ